MIKQCAKLAIVGGMIVIAAGYFFSPAQAEEPSLGLVGASNGVASVELRNDIPVRAIQFALTGVKITEVRTTSRTKGFLAKFNEQNGKVIIVSTAAEEIAPGKGLVAEIACDKPASAKLADVKIVGNKR